jgi:transcriptional regulator with XRE-family HTH domain
MASHTTGGTVTQGEAARRKEQGRRVKMARAKADLSQTELAEKISAEIGKEVSHTFISRIEKGKRDVEFGILLVIAKTCDVSVDFLLARSDNPGYRNPFYGLPLPASWDADYLNLDPADPLTGQELLPIAV